MPVSQRISDAELRQRLEVRLLHLLHLLLHLIPLLLQASFLEIYNEEIRDLLAVDKDLKYEIKMTDSKSSELSVTNLRVEEVVGEGQVAGLLRRAGKARAQAKTLCNERSSRSHSVFVLKIEGHNSKTLETCSGVLNLVSFPTFHLTSVVRNLTSDV